MSRTATAIAMGYSRTYVSKVESGHERPSREFAKAADEALGAGGAIKRAWVGDFDPVVSSSPSPGPVDQVPLPLSAMSVVVVHDDAELVYDGSNYRAVMRRTLENNGTEPVVQFMIQIAVDRFPGDPGLSNQLYRAEPLQFPELDLRAWYGNGRMEPMRWVVHHDTDAMKEVWLVFANESKRFPLYPGRSASIEYSYTVNDRKWGCWFQREVRLPTRMLTMKLDFPEETEVTVWGVQDSMSAVGVPFHTAIEEQLINKRRIFSWSTAEPGLQAQYRMEWRFDD
jgi:hypothetical protein